MVGDRHEAPGAELGAQRAGGVREDQRVGARGAEGPDRGRDRLDRRPLVEVAAALEDGDRDAAEVADHRAAGVAGDGREREAGKLLVGDDVRVGDRVGDGAEAGAEHDADAR